MLCGSAAQRQWNDSTFSAVSTRDCKPVWTVWIGSRARCWKPCPRFMPASTRSSAGCTRATMARRTQTYWLDIWTALINLWFRPLAELVNCCLNLFSRKTTTALIGGSMPSWPWTALAATIDRGCSSWLGWVCCCHEILRVSKALLA